MKIAVASSSWVGISALQHLLKKYEVSGVISSPDKPAGRGRELKANAFASFASEQRLNVIKPESHQELNAALKDLKPDLVVTVAYGRLVKPSELNIPKFGWLNIHFSLLPKWRGAAPVQYALWKGDQKTGITVFKLDEGLDTGPIYSQIPVLIEDGDNAETLLNKLSVIALPALDEAIEKISKGVEPVSQSNFGESLAPKISKAEGKIDWRRSNVEIMRQLRAFYPWPGCWSIFNGQRIQICSARQANLTQGGSESFGSLIVGDSILVQCGDGYLELLTVKPEGKREMTALEWVRGIQTKHLKFEA